MSDPRPMNDVGFTRLARRIRRQYAGRLAGEIAGAKSAQGQPTLARGAHHARNGAFELEVERALHGMRAAPRQSRPAA